MLGKSTGSEETGDQGFQIEATQSPAFARVRVGERVSNIAIVLAQESILEQLKVGKTKKIQEALDALDTDATEGVWLLDALELIDAEERLLALAHPDIAEAANAGTQRGPKRNPIAS